MAIHKANAHTMKHIRFLIGGNRLSSDPIAEPELRPETSNESNHQCNFGFQVKDNNNCSSITEYLISMKDKFYHMLYVDVSRLVNSTRKLAFIRFLASDFNLRNAHSPKS